MFFGRNFETSHKLMPTVKIVTQDGKDRSINIQSTTDQQSALDAWLSAHPQLASANITLASIPQATPIDNSAKYILDWKLPDDQPDPDKQDWLPLVSHIDGIRAFCLFYNMNPTSPAKGQYKKLLCYIYAGDTEITPVPAEDVPKEYAWILSGSHLYDDAKKIKDQPTSS